MPPLTVFANPPYPVVAKTAGKPAAALASAVTDHITELDTQEPEELMKFWAYHQHGRHAKALFPGGGRGTRLATADLAAWAANAAAAKASRKRGQINEALMYERIADDIASRWERLLENPRGGRFRSNGRTRTFPYRVEFLRVMAMDRHTGQWRPVGWTTQAWPSRTDHGGGRPTQANFERFIHGQERSTEPGGVNEHAGTTQILHARLVRQSDGVVMAEYIRAPFEVNPPDVPLEHFRALADAMHGGESQDWQWIGPHMSQRMFGISRARAEDYAKRYGGIASPMEMRANPPAGGRGRHVSDRVYEIRYKHSADGKNYRHPFQAGVCAEWLPDGSVRLYHRDGKPLMRDFPTRRRR